VDHVGARRADVAHQPREGAGGEAPLGAELVRRAREERREAPGAAGHHHVPRVARRVEAAHQLDELTLGAAALQRPDKIQDASARHRRAAALVARPRAAGKRSTGSSSPTPSRDSPIDAGELTGLAQSPLACSTATISTASTC
jgi:hypothetical protein